MNPMRIVGFLQDFLRDAILAARARRDERRVRSSIGATVVRMKWSVRILANQIRRMNSDFIYDGPFEDDHLVIPVSHEAAAWMHGAHTKALSSHSIVPNDPEAWIDAYRGAVVVTAHQFEFLATEFCVVSVNYDRMFRVT
jgi:hypothetical protein